MDKQELERFLDEGLSLAEIGRRLGRHEATIAYWLKRHGLAAVGRAKHAPRGAIDRATLERLVEAGMSITEVAAEVDRSKPTVRHWLMRYGLRTDGNASRSARRRARSGGLRTVTLACPRHGMTDFKLDGRGHYRCKRCSSEAVARRRRRMKQVLVAEAGGKCSLCGYRRSPRALHFHHLDPSQKRQEINARGVALALDTLRAEAQKCVLLCSNCHAEVEEGIILLPDSGVIGTRECVDDPG